MDIKKENALVDYFLAVASLHRVGSEHCIPKDLNRSLGVLAHEISGSEKLTNHGGILLGLVELAEDKDISSENRFRAMDAMSNIAIHGPDGALEVAVTTLGNLVTEFPTKNDDVRQAAGFLHYIAIMARDRLETFNTTAAGTKMPKALMSLIAKEVEIARLSAEVGNRRATFDALFPAS